ncbi:MAG: hypothetical protein RQ760_01655 [Sedimentisphaerales bacterium]|nr:hypothetical protein [Sedimentisphaerales bacterium]
MRMIIGSSCNGSYRDFIIAPRITEGKIRNSYVSFEINTGSRQTLDIVRAAVGAGSYGVRLQMEYLQKTLAKAMLMTGCKSLSEISSDIVLRGQTEDSKVLED